MTTLDRELKRDGHVHKFLVRPNVDGWEVLEEQDARVVHRVIRDDWHRVERDAMLFGVTAASLRQTGWVEHDPA
jgi:hypothetical protein